MTPQIRDFINRGMMPLVGREREMHVLLDAFAGLLEGEARAVWMTGAAGAGKSRLLDELKHRAADSPARSMVVHAKWYEGEGLELGPLGNALEVLRPAMAAPVAARIYRDGAIATVDAAVEAVQIAARHYPIIIILDDLHYLGSARTLERFIGAIEEIPLLLVCTSRPGDNPAPRAFRAALTSSIPPVEIEVGRLDGAGIAEAAEALFGTAPPEGMLEQIADLSGGLPLTMREVFLELMEREHLVADGASSWRWSRPLLGDAELRAVGDRVHGFSGRLASLPEHHRNVLGVAAALGEQFNRDLLRAVCERTIGWDDHAFEHLILKSFIAISTPSVRLGLRDGEGRVCFAFLHTLLWKATLAAPSPSEPNREEIALAALDALTRGTGELYSVALLEDGPTTTPSEIETQRRLLRWVVGVGAKLNAIYSESFAALCAAVLDPMRRTVTATGIHDSLFPLYLSALTAYGERLHAIGAGERLNDLATELSQLLDARPPEESADPERRIVLLEAAVVVWKNVLLRGENQQEPQLLDRLFATLPPPAEQSDRELRGAAEALRLLLNTPYRRGEFAGGLQHVAPYIAEMDRMQPEAIAALLPVLIPALHRTGRTAEAAQVIDTALHLCRNADVLTELISLRWAAMNALVNIDVPAARRYGEELRRVAERFPLYRHDIRPLQYLSSVAALEGNENELEELERTFRATPHTPITTHDTRIGVALRFQIGWNTLGQPDRANAIAADYLDSDDSLSQLHRYMLAREHLRSAIDTGEKEQIATALDRFQQQVERMGETYAPPGTDRHNMVTLLCTVATAIIAASPEPIYLWLKEHSDPEQIDDESDGIRAAAFLLAISADAPATERRTLCDTAYNIIEILMTRLQRPDNQLPGLAHHMLDRLAPHLPKTRLMRFRQIVGEDPRRAREVQKGEAAAPVAEGMESARTVRTFGALRVEGTQEAGAKLESKTRILVAALVVSQLGDNRALNKLTRDRFADLLWPDMPLEKAVNNLHANLSYARRFLGGPTTILQTDGVYSLGEDVAIDAVEFRENIRRGNRLYNEGVYFGAAVAYRHAIERAQGDFLEGMYAEWVDTTRETLRGELATAIERLIALEIDRENFTAVPPLAEQLLALDDLHDGAYEALIRSAAARGARREAFTWYKRYEAALDAYDARPTRRIAELMDRVRSGETVAGEEVE